MRSSPGHLPGDHASTGVILMLCSCTHLEFRRKTDGTIFILRAFVPKTIAITYSPSALSLCIDTCLGDMVDIDAVCSRVA